MSSFIPTQESRQRARESALRPPLTVVSEMPLVKRMRLLNAIHLEAYGLSEVVEPEPVKPVRVTICRLDKLVGGLIYLGALRYQNRDPERWADKFFEPQYSELILNSQTGDVVIHRPGVRPVYSRNPLS